MDNPGRPRSSTQIAEVVHGPHGMRGAPDICPGISCSHCEALKQGIEKQTCRKCRNLDSSGGFCLNKDRLCVNCEGD